MSHSALLKTAKNLKWWKTERKRNVEEIERLALHAERVAQWTKGRGFVSHRCRSITTLVRLQGLNAHASMKALLGDLSILGEMLNWEEDSSPFVKLIISQGDRSHASLDCRGRCFVEPTEIWQQRAAPSCESSGRRRIWMMAVSAESDVATIYGAWRQWQSRELSSLRLMTLAKPTSVFFEDRDLSQSQNEEF